MTETRRLFLILNGKSAPREDVRSAISRVRDAGHEVAVRVTYEPGDVARFVGEALGADTRPDAIVAGGGDGTLNQVVAALLDTDGQAQAGPLYARSRSCSAPPSPAIPAPPCPPHPA